MITFDDFAKLDIRIGTIISAEKIPEGDKLLKLIFDFGDEKRQIMSSIAEFFPNPEALVGKQMPVLMNLEAKTFRGYESQGMLIATDDANGIVFLKPETPVDSGKKVH
jgi:methionyl-tRNA synthetase